jgi:hypothetical protein
MSIGQIMMPPQFFQSRMGLDAADLFTELLLGQARGEVGRWNKDELHAEGVRMDHRLSNILGPLLAKVLGCQQCAGQRRLARGQRFRPCGCAQAGEDY